MQSVTLGKTDLNVSRLGFGAAPAGYLAAEPDKVRRILDLMLEHGVNLIDTAVSYPGSEQMIGNALAERREDAIIVSKCGHRIEGVDHDAWSEPLIAHAVDLSLERLQTQVIDVMMLHSCSLQTLENGEALEALVKAREQGKIRYIGYSGDNEAAAYAAGLDEIDVIEMSLNIVDQANLKTVLPLCQQRGLGVIAKRPLANAAWKSLTEQPGMYKQYAETYTRRLEAMHLWPKDLNFLGHADVEWPEIALRFVLSIEGVHSAVAGTTSLTNARANVDAAQRGPLADDVLERIFEAFDEAQTKAGQPWPGQV